MDHKDQEKKRLILPSSVASKVDLGRLIREVEALDEFLRQAAIREPGTTVKLPKSTRTMDEVISNNDLNLLREEERKYLKDYLSAIKNKGVVVHFSFSGDPTPAFTKKLVNWLRSNIHPYALIDVGMQPTLGAGCIVRTNNKIYDFSLRQRLISKRDLLLEAIRSQNSEENHKVAENEPATADNDGQSQAEDTEEALG